MSKRPTILLDLDGVLFDWAKAMIIEIVRRDEGEFSEGKVQSYLNKYQSWEIWDDLGVPKGHFDWVWEQSIREGTMYRGLPPFPGSVQALWRLSDAEYHIHVCTSRLNKFRLHDQAVINTVTWLREHGVPYRSLTFTEDKSVIEADVMIDDSPKNLRASRAVAKYLFPAPHNEKQAMEAHEKQDYSDFYPLDREQPWEDLLTRMGLQ